MAMPRGLPNALLASKPPLNLNEGMTILPIFSNQNFQLPIARMYFTQLSMAIGYFYQRRIENVEKSVRVPKYLALKEQSSSCLTPLRQCPTESRRRLILFLFVLFRQPGRASLM